MNQEQAILVSTEEMMVIAAASGLRRMLLFHPQYPEDRGQQIQAVHHLIRDGFLVSRPDGVTISEQLRPIVRGLHDTRMVVVLRTTQDGLLPICLYLQPDSGEAVYVTPSPNRSNLYRVGTLRPMQIQELLEPYVPSAKEKERKLPGNDDEIQTLELDWENEVNLNRLEADLGTTALTLFEKYGLGSDACAERLAVYRGMYSWMLSFWRPGCSETKGYDRREIMRWLWEEAK